MIGRRKKDVNMTDEQKAIDGLLLKKIAEAESCQDRLMAVDAYFRFQEACVVDSFGSPVVSE